ncbi:MAG TPA: acyltransferase [Verrucomicrobiae bacterium]|nr:acyltransferase [Verrucomicrobiae bacterium]
MVLLLGMGAMIFRSIPFFRATIQASQATHYEALDGLRGYLALAVFFHHAVVQYNFYRTGTWGAVGSQFYSALGPTGVMFFFMITGFLFWSKAIAKNGHLPALGLYRNRFLRLAPLYLFSILVILLIVAERSHFHISSSPLGLMAELGRALSLGMGPVGVINGVDTRPVNAGVTWSLRYEWAFYLLLPLTARLVRRPLSWRFVVLAAIITSCSWIWLPQWPAGDRILCFLYGMCTAHLVAHFSGSLVCRTAKRSWVGALAMLLVVLSLLSHGSFWNVQFAGLAFVCFALGNDLLGLLRIRGAKVLGTISYSIYLLHGIALYLALRIMNHFYPVVAMKPLPYWGLIGACAVFVVACSAVTYRLFEHPFIALSHKRRTQAERRPPDPQSVSAAEGPDHLEATGVKLR